MNDFSSIFFWKSFVFVEEFSCVFVNSTIQAVLHQLILEPIYIYIGLKLLYPPLTNNHFL